SFLHSASSSITPPSQEEQNARTRNTFKAEQAVVIETDGQGIRTRRTRLLFRLWVCGSIPMTVAHQSSCLTGAASIRPFPLGTFHIHREPVPD
ncbi:hypothetical protein, partial [Methylobacterium nigriterrae]|uniref:hypothetical protein n=1 Tax=Methylobacterium nigriterrae TaxID=3127512 RepID=UPI003013DCB8